MGVELDREALLAGITEAADVTRRTGREALEFCRRVMACMRSDGSVDVHGYEALTHEFRTKRSRCDRDAQQASL